jgi:hypothetical protein
MSGSVVAGRQRSGRRSRKRREEVWREGIQGLIEEILLDINKGNYFFPFKSKLNTKFIFKDDLAILLMHGNAFFYQLSSYSILSLRLQFLFDFKTISHC